VLDVSDSCGRPADLVSPELLDKTPAGALASRVMVGAGRYRAGEAPRSDGRLMGREDRVFEWKLKALVLGVQVMDSVSMESLAPKRMIRTRVSVVARRKGKRCQEWTGECFGIFDGRFREGNRDGHQRDGKRGDSRSRTKRPPLRTG